MRILLAGPKICSPWTEGRKRFVQDVAVMLGASHEVRVLTSVEKGETTQFAVPWVAPVADTGARHLRQFHTSLSRLLKEWRPELVCHFPISSFHGKYRLGNLASMWLADHQCSWHGIPCLTLMYAISLESSVVEVRRWVRHLLVNQYTKGARQIRFGAALPEHAAMSAPGNGRSLLFMAGMAEPTAERLEYVLRVRGLATLLRAGEQLANSGFRLTVAVPLLADPALRASLLQTPGNTWPIEQLNLLDTIKVPDVFDGHDYFIFPYGRDEPQFIPNSVIEAMHYGVPTVLPRLSFLRHLIRDDTTSFSFFPGDSDDLVRVLCAAISNTPHCQEVRRNAALMVRKEFNIAGTCEDILAYFSSLTPTDALSSRGAPPHA